MKLSDLFSDAGRPVLYYPKVAEFAGGITEGLFLAQLIYWQGHQRDKDGWIYKTHDEWEEETGLSRKSQYNARKTLKEKGFITEKYEGLPQHLCYKLETDMLDKAWENWHSSMGQNAHTDVSKGTPIKGSIEYTENTSSASGAAKPTAENFLVGESHREWWIRVCKDSGEATVPLIGGLYVRLFGKHPGFGRLGKIFTKELRRNPKFIFCVVCDTLKAEIVGEPYNYMQSLVSSGKKQVEPPRTAEQNATPDWANL